MPILTIDYYLGLIINHFAFIKGLHGGLQLSSEPDYSEVIQIDFRWI